jgi:hypothetical protein
MTRWQYTWEGTAFSTRDPATTICLSLLILQYRFFACYPFQFRRYRKHRIKILFWRRSTNKEQGDYMGKLNAGEFSPHDINHTTNISRWVICSAISEGLGTHDLPYNPSWMKQSVGRISWYELCFPNLHVWFLWRVWESLGLDIGPHSAAFPGNLSALCILRGIYNYQEHRKRIFFPQLRWFRNRGDFHVCAWNVSL